MTNSEDKDEALHNAAPHHGPHSIQSTKATHFTEHGTHGVTPTLTNSEDPDEVPHNAASHQGPHCLLSNKLKTIPEYIVHSEVTIIALLTNS